MKDFKIRYFVMYYFKHLIIVRAKAAHLYFNIYFQFLISDVPESDNHVNQKKVPLERAYLSHINIKKEKIYVIQYVLFL